MTDIIWNTHLKERNFEEGLAILEANIEFNGQLSGLRGHNDRFSGHLSRLRGHNSLMLR